MGKWLKKVFRVCFLCLFLLATFYGAYRLYQSYQRYSAYEALISKRPAVKKAKDGTSISPAWYSEAEYEKKIRKNYPFIYNVSFNTPSLTNVGKNVVIPGLVSTKSFNFKNKKFETSGNMTPQGLAIAGEYLLITAYDGKHEHASVIWVLDKNTGKYLKTVQVPGRPHLGGIAYDPVAQNIWLTSSLGDESALASFPLKALIEYKGRKPIKYNNRMALPGISRASTVTYFDNQLFVGFFNMYEKGTVAAYPIARSGNFKGSITTNEIKASTGSAAWSTASGSASMDKQIQGIAFYQDKIFLSQSYGSQNSKLYIFSTNALNSLDEKNAEKVIDMPPYLEQLTVEHGQLLCLFESGSKNYARSQITIMDRILSININALFATY
ncbi:YncE family protein [Lactobacillus psittaci]|uniref:Uncharacterized protein n=1 Tax=Lactobacillus psittaci DSM 15354 TaxID=1122152 RepID=A0A0R1S1L1_9LACO|nr:hypothetical protein FC23_GL001183 [Lactobacillus psittaci DSM 15354]